MTREDMTKNMARTIEVVIRISEEDFKIMKHNIAVNNPLCPLSEDKMVSKVANGTPLPERHGDLIDASKIQFENNEFDTYSDYSRAFDAIDDAPTIIPADTESGGEENAHNRKDKRI